MMRSWRRRLGMPARGGGLPAATPAEERDERLSRYLDGELGGEAREAVERELASAGEARAALEGMREVREALRALGDAGRDGLRAPRPFTLAEPPPARRGAPRIPRGRGGGAAPLAALGAALAALALVAVVGIGVGPGLEGRDARETADAPAAAPEARTQAQEAAVPVGAPEAAAPVGAREAAAPVGARGPAAEAGAAAAGGAEEGAPRARAEADEGAGGGTGSGRLPAGTAALLALALAAASGAAAAGALALRRRRGRPS